VEQGKEKGTKRQVSKAKNFSGELATGKQLVNACRGGSHEKTNKKTGILYIVHSQDSEDNVSTAKRGRTGEFLKESRWLDCGKGE